MLKATAVAASVVVATTLSSQPASAFPGPAMLKPGIHFVPTYVSDAGGWHDVAGAITEGGRHHVSCERV